MLEHGQSVWSYTEKLLNSDTSHMRLPQWFISHKEQILNNLHDIETIRLYNVYHDNGKHLCKIVDSEGKVHYPNHAQVSKQNWLAHGGDETVARLIGLDMVMHTESIAEIKERNLPIKDGLTLLITALAELHANAEMFGSIDSTSFKIKFKKIDKVGKFLCDHYFNHPYSYVIVRKDLSPAQKAVQSCHASIEAARAFHKPNDIHPSVIICEVKSEDKLKMVMNEINGMVRYKAFQEPDIGNQYTALATEPVTGDTRKIFSRFQLIS